VAQQGSPIPTPNYAPHAAAHLLAVAWRISAWNATRFAFGIKNSEPHTQPVGLLAYITAPLFFRNLLVQNESYAHTPSLVATPSAMHLSTGVTWLVNFRCIPKNVILTS
jgi:hypothetical protein